MTVAPWSPVAFSLSLPIPQNIPFFINKSKRELGKANDLTSLLLGTEGLSLSTQNREMSLLPWEPLAKTSNRNRIIRNQKLQRYRNRLSEAAHLPEREAAYSLIRRATSLGFPPR
uniref:Uncharacterized protein n=1 Tax=Utricularia reniformis TaxID=192314 RepID=A0A1Y0AYP6_9LAMI|nr:hypothetical protein AEK19_MT0234 [Utricularia reniformis]ART30268.1 hypothetical protein AEK19_MT0234 [Utricularia reniformis]